MFNLKSLLLVLFFFTSSVLANEMKIYKSPYCGCCTAWAKQVDDAGFNIEIIEQANNNQLRKDFAIPASLASCHTAIIDGYVIEGHVPMADITRLLTEKPAITGLAVAGMPASSPGMDVEGNTDPYQVIAFDKTGNKSVYNQYNIK